MSADAPRVALLDVNVLVALFDTVHVHHEAAHEWFARQREHGWATCPIVENGLVRVLSHPAYPGSGTSLPDAIARLAAFAGADEHRFWPDDVSLIDNGLCDATRIAGHGQIKDVYLLALAVHHDSALATFDRGISLAAVPEATDAHLARVG